MKYRKMVLPITLAALVSLGLGSLGGCASNDTPATTAAPIQTPAQIAAQVCPLVQAALTGLQALTTLPENARQNLNTAVPLVNAVCAANATVNVASLQALGQTALPAILDIVAVSGLSATEQNQLVLGIGAVQVVLSAVMHGG